MMVWLGLDGGGTKTEALVLSLEGARGFARGGPSNHQGVDFDEMARHRGAGYYLGPQGARPNPHYRAHPPLRELRAALMAAPGAGPQDLYQAVMAAPDRYRFLHPL